MRALAALLIILVLATSANAQRRIQSTPQPPVTALSKFSNLVTDWRPPYQNINIEGFEPKKIGFVEKADFKILSIIDDENCLLASGTTIIWLSDYPTKNLVNDQRVCIYGAVSRRFFWSFSKCASRN